MCNFRHSFQIKSPYDEQTKAELLSLDLIVEIEEYIHILESEFQKNANAKIALEQKAYMRDKFEYFGLRAADRREIQKPFFVKEYLPTKMEFEELTKTLWMKPQRDYQYFSQELSMKFNKEDIALIEFMISHKSWWDTVDFIATKLLGEYFKMYPVQREIVIKKWLESNNIWLQRSCLLFQLKYKEEVDTLFLNYVICSLLGSNEFFINKAIGWVLREYSKTNPGWVVDFVKTTELSALSKREALRLLN